MGEQGLLFDVTPDPFGARILSRLPEGRRAELIRLLAEMGRRGLRPAKERKEGERTGARMVAFASSAFSFALIRFESSGDDFSLFAASVAF